MAKINYGRRKGAKYGNVSGRGYASRKERKRAYELRALEEAGIISELREQVPFVLIPAQYGDAGRDLKGRPVCVCLERSCKYVADFVYRDPAGALVVEDTKGVRTKDYIIKRKLMLRNFGIRIVEK